MRSKPKPQRPSLPPALTAEGFSWWKSLPETQAVQAAVFQKVLETRIEIAKKLAIPSAREGLEEYSALINGMEFAHSYDDLFDFERTPNAEDGRTPSTDKAQARRGPD